MITMVPIEAGNVIGVSIDGKISIEDLDKITGQVEKQLETHQKFRKVGCLDGLAVAKHFTTGWLAPNIFRLRLRLAKHFPYGFMLKSNI